MIDEKDADYFIFEGSCGFYCITPAQKKRDFGKSGGDNVTLCPVISIDKANKLLKGLPFTDDKDIA